MSLMGMNRWVKKHGPVVAVVMLVAMVGGVAYTGLGQNLGGGANAPEQNSANEPAVAKIGTRSITRSMLDQQLEQMYRSQGSAPPEERDSDRINVIEQLKVQQALLSAAEKNKVTPTDTEIEAERQKVWTEGGRMNYTQALGLKPDASDTDINAALTKMQPGLTVQKVLESYPKDALQTRLADQKLRDAMKSRVPADPAMVKRFFNEIKVRHILIKSGEGGLPDSQAREKAEKILKEALAKPAGFPDLAKKHSEDGNAKDGGFYDWKPANYYVAAFSQGAFAAGKGKINPSPVKTTFGYHLIELIDERPSKTAPADLEKNIARYVDEFKARESGSLVQAEVDAAKTGITATLIDSGLKAAELQRDALKANGPARDAKLAEALAELNKITKADDREGALPLRRGKLLDLLKKYDQSAQAYEEALALRNIPETHISAAQAYVELKQNDKAKKHLEEAEKLALPSAAVVYSMATLYDKLGNKEKQKAFMAKAQEMARRQQEQLMKQLQEQMKNQATPPPIAKPTPAPDPAKK